MVRNNFGGESRVQRRVHWRDRVKQRRHSELPCATQPCISNEVKGTNQALRRRTRSCTDLNVAFIGKLDIVTGIIDVDDEQDNLDKAPGTSSEALSQNEEEEEEELGTEFLNREKLTEVIELTMKKHQFRGPVSDQVVSLVSLAARERFCFIFENLKQCALARLESELNNTTEEECEILDVRELLERERNEEEERLVEEKNKRKYRKEQEAQERKRKLCDKIHEKKKEEEEVIRKTVMDNLLSGILRKRKKTKFSPLVIPSQSHNDTKPEEKPKQHKLQFLDPDPDQTISIALEDCLQFFSSEPNTRKTDLIYKWYTRLEQSISKKKKKKNAESDDVD